MSEDHQATLRPIFNKVSSEDSFAHLIGMNPVYLKPAFARAILTVTDERDDHAPSGNGTTVTIAVDHGSQIGTKPIGPL